MRLSLFFDMRAPDLGTPPDRLYQAAVEMAAWADGLGFWKIRISEHHGAEDGYCPSPAVLGAAVAARTRQVRIHWSALIAPLHHPLRIAEDLAVLDLISNGRLDVTVAGGYRSEEFPMFGADPHARGRSVEELVAVLKQAWTGEPFDFRGQKVVVRPTPVQKPRPTILLGGSTEPAARRAARIADGFVPGSERDPGHLHRVFAEERRRLGLDIPPRQPPGAGWFLHISEDPEADWNTIAPHAWHETNSYARWKDTGLPSGHSTWQRVADYAALRATGRYRMMTPDQAVEFALSLDAATNLNFHPLMGGLDPAVSWRSLELFERRVMPKLRDAGRLPET
jgi:alkanesulfonate monooxygenase SsuD/methylene tetrahydromethanopterin reductase-like flavin-dependent oxidoreductase (luciferase family)